MGAERGRPGKSRDRTLFQIDNITEKDEDFDQASILPSISI